MSPPTVAKADHRPLAEMFAILTTDPEPEPEPELPPEPEPEPEPEAVAVAEHEAEAVAPSEPELHDDAGLFRRL
jgi:hypothetical protein